MNLRSLSLLGLIGFLAAVPLFGQDAANSARPSDQVLVLYKDWKAETDPEERMAKAKDLLQFIWTKETTDFPNYEDISADISRQGFPQRLMDIKSPAVPVPLKNAQVLTGFGPFYSQDGPVMRRISANRVEIWSRKEGWLFDGQGKLLVHVTAPRRDGKGRDWYGAFLPDGHWITTDLWDDDQQLNFYSPSGEHAGVLFGKDILPQFPKPKNPNDFHEANPALTRPSFGWARADKTGRRWLISLGIDYNYDREFAFVTPDRKITPLSSPPHVWTQVYPRAMSTRGFISQLNIESGDGKITLQRELPMHGCWIGFPTLNLSNVDDKTVYLEFAGDHFNFWPKSHHFYAESDSNGEIAQMDWYTWHPFNEFSPTSAAPQHLYFYDPQLTYEGDMPGRYVGDAANGTDILVADSSGTVNQVHLSATAGPGTVASSTFTHKGTALLPLALYDDLKMGFFITIRPPLKKGQPAPTEQRVIFARWN